MTKVMTMTKPDHLIETPYAGLIGDEQAVPGPHVLVSGPTGTGKSRRVLGPGILLWQGPVVAISSKPDLIELCLPTKRARQGAKTYVIDLSGDVPDEMLHGATRCVVDPVALIKSPTDALEMATILIQASKAGGGQSGGGGDAFWDNLATPPLAAILYAAGQGGIRWAVDAVGLVDDPGNPDTPSWSCALRRLTDMKEYMLARKLESTTFLDDKQKSSVLITMDTALGPWLHGAVRGRGDELVFTPDLLRSRNSSLFMVAPADGLAAGAAVGLVDTISKRWRKNQTEARRLPRILFVVDELCNTLPWQKLPIVVTESRAMGINLLVAVQGTSQFSRRFGHDGMTELRDVFPTVLLLVGAPEEEMLERAAKWAGESPQVSSTVDHASRQSLTTQKTGSVSATSLRPRSVDEARLLRGKRPGDTGPGVKPEGVRVDLLDISKMKLLTE